MAISAKAVPVLIVKFLRFSIKFICKYANKYPLPSATLFTIFILHLFFPFAFIFLVFSIPFFLFGYIVYRRFVFVPSYSNPETLKQKTLESVKPAERDEDVEIKNRGIKSQITRRRNVKPDVEGTKQGDVKRVKFHLSDNDVSAIERKEVAEETLKDDAEESDDEDDAQEDQIMEWTEDDQKNLLEVGFSELEKNLTLENLIAKRNAGKLPMSPKAPETVVAVPHVSVTRSNPFEQIPGTAPSVFSRNNPFDLPMIEGGRNVKFDIFEQDLVGLDRNKEKLCRHQSFTRGTSFSAENLQNQESRMLGLFSCMERILAGESESDKGDHDRFIEQLLYQDESSEVASSPGSEKRGEQVTEETPKTSEIGETDSGKDVELDFIQTEDVKDPSSSKSEELKEISNAEENQEILDSLNPEIVTALMNRDSDKANQTLLNDYVNRNVSHHNSMSSVASDMQVEVSEPASPRNISSIGDLQMLISEGEIEGLKEKIGSSAKPLDPEVPKEEEIHSEKTEVKQLDMKETDMNSSASTAQNVGDSANPNAITENPEKPDSATQQATLEHQSEVVEGRHEQSGAPLEQVKS